jgi:hypothetical protein
MVKKKSKFRHISINKKKYYFYEIKWVDILGDSGHATAKEFDLMKPAVMITNAYVFKKDKKQLLTFASYDENEESFSDRNVLQRRYADLVTENKNKGKASLRKVLWKKALKGDPKLLIWLSKNELGMVDKIHTTSTVEPLPLIIDAKAEDING